MSAPALGLTCHLLGVGRSGGRDWTATLASCANVVEMGRAKRIIGVVLALGATITFAVVAEDERPVEAASETSRFVGVSPLRVMDTRTGVGVASGSRHPGETITMRLAGATPIPANATAVVLNVTITESRQAGWVQAFPTGVGVPGASSNLNVMGPGVTMANKVIVPVGMDGNVSFLVDAGGHLLADVFGYFEPSAQSTSGRYLGLPAPARVLDTRNPLQVPIANPGDVRNCSDFRNWNEANHWFWTYRRHGDPARLDGDGNGIPCESLPGNTGRVVIPPDLFKIGAQSAYRLPIRTNASPAGGVLPPDATAVVVNITAADATATGFLQLYASPNGAVPESHSNVNYVAGEAAPNLAIVPIGADGAITIYSYAPSHVIADVIGYFTGPSSPQSTAGLFTPLTPTRVRDTRQQGGAVAPESLENVNIAAAAGLPANNAAAVFLNATVDQSQRGGYLQLYPTGAGTPGASSNVNVAGAGQTRPNAAVSGLSDGQVTVYHYAGGHYILDLAGYFTAGVG